MDVIVPKVGLTVEVVQVLQWHAAPGDEVSAGDPLVDVAADKTDVEVEAPADGVLAEVLAEAGAEVRPGAVIGRIAASGVAEPAVAAPAAADAVLAREPTATPVARRAAEALGIDLATVHGSGAGGRIRRRDVESAANGNGRKRFAGGTSPSSPAARRLAGELGVALAAAVGTGPGGRIVEADVRRAAARATAAGVDDRRPAATPDVARAAVPATPTAGTPARWTAARRATARRLSESAATVAPVTLHRRADAGAALAAARTLKDRGVRATFTHVVLACTAAALREHPEVNSVWAGDQLLRADAIHLGLAVDMEDGLVVPVIRDADRLSVGDLATIAGGLVAACRSRTIAPENLRDSTFSVSNLGMLGIEQFTPIINPPHVAILGVGAVVEEALPAPEGLRFRKGCFLSLTFDHRALDGAPAARFLDTLIGQLETFTP